jgi:hypothetical protein
MESGIAFGTNRLGDSTGRKRSSMINKESTTIANERQGKKLERFSIEILTAAHRLPRSIALDRPVSCRSLLIVV